jgi:hypothetical protein
MASLPLQMSYWRAEGRGLEAQGEETSVSFTEGEILCIVVKKVEMGIYQLSLGLGSLSKFWVHLELLH